MKKNTLLAAPFVLVLVAMLSYGQVSPFTRTLAVYTNGVIANVPNFFEANKAALNASVSNQPASGSVGSGLLVCSTDDTVHALGVYQMGTNYLLSLVLTTNAATPSTPASIPLVSGDLSVHQLYVQKLGTNYSIGLTQ